MGRECPINRLCGFLRLLFSFMATRVFSATSLTEKMRTDRLALLGVATVAASIDDALSSALVAASVVVFVVCTLGASSHAEYASPYLVGVTGVA